MQQVDNKEQSLIARSSGLVTKDYIAYALGDVGCCLTFGLVTSLLQTYYTDVLMLSPLFIMIMFIVARVWDAINDPIMGRICDTVRVNPKRGRYKVWFLYGGIPLAIATVLMFIKFPGFGKIGNNLPAYFYATITYILFGMSYTMVQIPYGSLASVVTLDDKERSTLSIWRSVGAAFGSMPVIILQMLCFVKDDNGQQIVKYNVLIIGVVIMAVLSFVALVFAYRNNKERVMAEPAVHVKGATLKAIKTIAGNKAMMSVSVAAMLLLAGQMFTQSYYTYLIRYYFSKDGIFTTIPIVLTYVPMAILMFFTPKLTRKFGKKEITAWGMVVATVANLAMFFLKFLPPEVALWPFFALCFISGMGLNFFVLQVWAMASDAIDDIEVRTGERDDATAYSAFTFFRKLGQVISAVAVNGALLAMGYFATSEGKFEFDAKQLEIMFILATIIPAAMFGIMALLLFIWYPLSKSEVEKLQEAKEAKLRLEANNMAQMAEDKVVEADEALPEDVVKGEEKI